MQQGKRTLSRSAALAELMQASQQEVGLTQNGNRKGHFTFSLPSMPPRSLQGPGAGLGPVLPLLLLSPPSLQSLLDQSLQSCIAPEPSGFSLPWPGFRAAPQLILLFS